MTKKKTIKKGGPISKSNKKEIVEQLKQIFASGEIMYLSERDLSSRLNIARQTVKRYLEEVKKEVPAKDVTLISLKFKQYLEEAIEDIRACWKHSKKTKDTYQMKKDIDMMFRAIEKFTDFLERFFIKPKAAEEINHNITQKQIIMNVNMVAKDEGVKEKEVKEVVEEKILVTGVPKSGKTTLCEQYANVLHTDDLIGKCEWSEASLKVSAWFDKPYSFIEGVVIPRALRKWLKRNVSGKPCDRIVFLANPRVEVSKGQVTMGKGVVKVFNEIKQELLDRGVSIEYE